jgi:hypothetical protein
MSLRAVTYICGSSARFQEDGGKTMTAPGSQEWLKSATSGEIDTSIGVNEGEVKVKVFVMNCQVLSM